MYDCCVATINISIPDRIKEEAKLLVKAGLYASFSDFVRDSMRQALKRDKYEVMFEKAKQDEKEGKAIILDSDEDIDNFINKI